MDAELTVLRFEIMAVNLTFHSKDFFTVGPPSRSALAACCSRDEALLHPIRHLYVSIGLTLDLRAHSLGENRQTKPVERG